MASNMSIKNLSTSTATANKVKVKVSSTESFEKIQQAKYGVHIVDAQPAYGAQVPYIPQPQSPVTTPDLNITYSQLEENIASLNKAISTLTQSWDVQTKKNIDTLNNSWVGADCEAYTKKVLSMDKRVKNAITALKLLRDTYVKAKDMVSETQTSTLKSINSIE